MVSKADKVTLRRVYNKFELIREILSELDLEEIPELDLSLAQFQEQIEEIIDAE